MQLCKFPMEYLRVTQGEYGAYSHKGSLAMDFGGKDTGSDKLYAPFDFKVIRARSGANGELYIESTQPVDFADGTVDYCHLLFIHDSSFNVVEGNTYPQGYYFYDEGGMGSGNPNRFGTHVHIEGGKGKWQSASQFQNAYGVWVSENQNHLYDLFILGDDVIEIFNETNPSYNYDWKRVSDFEEPEEEEPEPETSDEYKEQYYEALDTISQLENEIELCEDNTKLLQEENLKLNNLITEISNLISNS